MGASPDETPSGVRRVGIPALMSLPQLEGNEMNGIWHLSRSGTGYNEAYNFVVVAPNETTARETAAGFCGDEGVNTWLSSMTSDCELIGAAYPLTPIGLVCRDFYAG
jgi:hypothetical protein